jgi:hypothetical protein
MPDPSLSPFQRLIALEARHDGPIPAAARRALAFGSALEAAIAEAEAEAAFFRGLIGRTRRAGKAWRARGNRAMAAQAQADCALYLEAWRTRRRRLAALLSERPGAHIRRPIQMTRPMMATSPGRMSA